ERAERLAHGGAADAEPDRELVLADPLAGPERARHDLVGEDRRRAVGERLGGRRALTAVAGGRRGGVLPVARPLERARGRLGGAHGAGGVDAGGAVLVRGGHGCILAGILGAIPRVPGGDRREEGAELKIG